MNCTCRVLPGDGTDLLCLPGFLICLETPTACLLKPDIRMHGHFSHNHLNVGDQVQVWNIVPFKFLNVLLFLTVASSFVRASDTCGEAVR